MVLPLSLAFLFVTACIGICQVIEYDTRSDDCSQACGNTGCFSYWSLTSDILCEVTGKRHPGISAADMHQGEDNATFHWSLYNVTKVITGETKIIRCGQRQKIDYTATNSPATNTTSASITPSTAHQTEGACVPKGGMIFRGSCYMHFSAKVGWKTAKNSCRRKQMYLVEISNHEENTILISYLKGREQEKVWIGLSDLKKEGIWVWKESRRRSTYFNWAVGAPDGRQNKFQLYLQEEDCVEINVIGNFKWNDRDCDAKARYVCESRNI